MTSNNSPSPKSNQNTSEILWRCLQYLRPYWKSTLGIYVAMLVIIGITILIPQLIRWIIDRGVYGNDMQFLSRAVVALLVLAAVQALVMYLQGNWTEVASQYVAFDLRNEIQRKKIFKGI